MDTSERNLEALKSRDEELRRQAVKALGELKDKRYVEVLVEAMGDPSWRVRKEASEAIVSYDDPAIVSFLLPGLRDENNAGLRNTVVETLIRLGPRAVPQVAQLLGDEDSDIRKFTVDILGGMAFEEVIPFLMEALQDEDENVVAAAAEFLGEKGDARAIPHLLALLRRPSFWLKFCALRAIGQLADEEQEDEVILFLRDPALRLEASEVLARIGGETSFDLLLDLCAQGNAKERQKFLQALLAILCRLGVRPGESAVRLEEKISHAGLRQEFETHLARAIGDTAGSERMTVLRAARYFPSPIVLEGLIGIMEDAQEEEHEEICRALLAFPAEFLPALTSYLSASSAIVRRQVACVFAQRSYPPALATMLSLLRNDDGHVRASMARALGKIGDQSALEPLIEMLGDPYADVRAAVVEALTEMAGDAAVRAAIAKLVVSSLETRGDQVSEGCLQVLGSLRDEAFVPVFSRYLKDARARIRRAALLGLGNLGTTPSLGMLLTALTDEDRDIRLEAIRYLGGSRNRAYAAPIQALVEDEDAVVAAEALKALRFMGDDESFAILSRTASGGGGLKQLAAVKALAAIGGRRERSFLLELLPSLQPEGRKEVILMLGKSPDDAGRKVILNALEDGDWSVRLSAVEALREDADAEALKLLKDKYHAREKDPMVRRAMETAIKALE